MNMDDLRNKLRIDALGTVNVVFSINEFDPNAGAAAKFDCLACDVGLRWTGTFNRYECPECGIELTAQEAIDLCEKYHKLLDALAKEAGKKESFWRRLFK